MTDDGWITDKDVIFTTLKLKALKVGDELVMQNMHLIGVAHPSQYDGKVCVVIEAPGTGNPHVDAGRYAGVVRTDHPRRDANRAYFEDVNVAAWRPYVPKKET